MFCVIFAWRAPGPDKRLWLSERYISDTSELPAARTRFRKDLRGSNGRLVYAKLHSGTGYISRGRFV